MSDTIVLTEAEKSARCECIEFTRKWNTPGVRRGMFLADIGRVSWIDLRDLFARSLSSAMEEVR